MAHFAVTDPVNGAFHAHERFSRGAAGLAGVQSKPFRAWLEDWEIRGSVTNHLRFGSCIVTEGGTSIELELDAR